MAAGQPSVLVHDGRRPRRAGSRRRSPWPSPRHPRRRTPVPADRARAGGRWPGDARRGNGSRRRARPPVAVRSGQAEHEERHDVERGRSVEMMRVVEHQDRRRASRARSPPASAGSSVDSSDRPGDASNRVRLGIDRFDPVEGGRDAGDQRDGVVVVTLEGDIRDTRVAGRAHWRSNVVLPYPAGATMDTTAALGPGDAVDQPGARHHRLPARRAARTSSWRGGWRARCARGHLIARPRDAVFATRGSIRPRGQRGRLSLAWADAPSGRSRIQCDATGRLTVRDAEGWTDAVAVTARHVSEADPRRSGPASFGVLRRRWDGGCAR